MKIKYLFFCIATITPLLGCVPNNNRDYNTGGGLNQSALSISKKTPQVLGWDKNGYKVFNTNKEKLALNNKATAKKAILVEDAIVCEEKDILLSFVEKTHDYINNKTGADFVEIAKSQVSYYKKMSLIKAESNYYQAKALNDFKPTNPFYVKKAYKEDSMSPEETATATLAESFLKYCSANKKPQLVNTIERKPISKITKIKLLIDNQPYDMWTMEEHLINPIAQ